MMHLVKRLLGLMFLALTLGQPIMGETIMTTDKTTVGLGAVQVGDRAVRLQIASGDDFALLELSVTGADGVERYVPIFASTYRGIPAVTLDVFTSQARDQVWVQASWPETPVLAHHRLGSDIAITTFGEVDLLATPFPAVLSGGPVPFPAMDAQDAVRLATFYLP